jgi:hypothetical protein
MIKKNPTTERRLGSNTKVLMNLVNCIVFLKDGVFMEQNHVLVAASHYGP